MDLGSGSEGQVPISGVGLKIRELAVQISGVSVSGSSDFVGLVTPLLYRPTWTEFQAKVGPPKGKAVNEQEAAFAQNSLRATELYPSRNT